MNPATIAALLQTVAQLALIVEELKQGLITQQQAWEQQQAGLNQALAAWEAAKSGVQAPLPGLQSPSDVQVHSA